MPVDRSAFLLERAHRWETEAPDRIYLVQPLGQGRVREYTWRQAMDEARRMAAHLVSLNLPPGSRIAILSKNCAELLLSDLAIWMAGHVSVALYPTLTPDIVRYVLEHSAARVLFVGKLDGWEAMRPGVPEGLDKIIYTLGPAGEPGPRWDEIVRRTSPLEGPRLREPDDLAIVMYTSGSTGTPKGVEHSFGTLGAGGAGLARAVNATAEDRMISYLPLAHAFERAAVEAISLHCGCRVFFAESLDTFISDLKRARPTIFHSVPRLWLKFQQGVFAKMPQKKLERLLRVPGVGWLVRRKVLAGLGLDATRLAVTGSAPTPQELIGWYRRLGLELLEGYAMSENFCYSHLSRPGQTRLGYVGHPLPGVEVRLGDDGEVLMKGPANMRGYHKDPALTAETIDAGGYLHTGDRGELDDEGRLRLTGRVKELFKTSKGKYVSPAPVENLLNADGTVEQSCVMGEGQPQPFALVLLAEALRKRRVDPALRGELEAALFRLRASVNAQLPPYEHLELLVVVKEPWLIENGFLTPTLKIKRSVIEERYAPRVGEWYAARRPVVWE